MAEKQKAESPKCMACGELIEFDRKKELNGFACDKSAGKHVVEHKTYYHPGGRHIQSLRDRRMFSPLIILSPRYDVRDPGTGAVLTTRGVSAQFADGKYTTNDPEEQFYLDQSQEIKSGAEGERLWESIYLTPQQQLDIKKAELADTQRQIKESNELLAKVKGAKGIKEAVGASA